MATDDRESIDIELLNEQMDRLAREIVGKPDYPRRTEIVGKCRG